MKQKTKMVGTEDAADLNGLKSFGTLKPQARSAVRIFCGRKYYTMARYLKWLKNYRHFARKRMAETLSYQITAHETPLYRKLRNVDMWLQSNKAVNLKCAAAKLNGICLYPGETFSYWHLIGKPTYRKGYRDGMILHYGHYKHGVGGGLCQLSNMIYWMALHTPLTVTERHRHSYDVFPDSNRKQPFGSGATCVYNYRDLQIKNETDHVFQMCFEINDTHLKGQIRSSDSTKCHYEVYESEHAIMPQPWGGYIRHNVICRKVNDETGQPLKIERICENNALMMYEPLLPANENHKHADK